MYPLVQGFDSVMLKADVELGGNDQKFNLLVGRELQKAHGQKPQIILTIPLLEGLDGVQKMSKSLDNYIGITESPKEMFGKVMSISDTQMIRYYELLSDQSTASLQNLFEQLKNGQLHPKAAKINLARELVARFHNHDLALQAENDFTEQFSQKNAAKDRTIIAASTTNLPVVDYLHSYLPHLEFSKSEFKRLFKQTSIRLYSKGDLSMEKILSETSTTDILKSGDLIKIGKRNWVEIK